MTDRLYYHDSFLTQFEAQVIEADGARIYLDRTAFYPTSGGQPHDVGVLNGVPVMDVIDEGDRIAHLLAEPLAQNTSVIGNIDWTRRFDHMQQHTGQHLLSAVFIEQLQAETVSFHMGAESCTIDLDVAELKLDQVRAVEQRANAIVFENRPVHIRFGNAADDLGLRKRSEREGTIRVITIEGMDRSACGGTHVRATGEIGPILIRKLDKVRGLVRVEFVCGGRAIRAARNDYDALSAIARTFSAPAEQAPALVIAQMERLQAADRARKTAQTELAVLRGKQLYADATEQGGIRYVLRRLPTLGEDTGVEAQSFTSGAKAVYAAIGEQPPAVLLASSKDSGVNAGQRLKAILSELNGRGGGSAQVAQGSLASAGSLSEAAEALSLSNLLNG